MQSRFAVIFDMDGVLTDTAALHRESWLTLAAEEGIAFAPADYEAMRGLARDESLRIFLGERFAQVPEAERRRLMQRKQALFEEHLRQLSERDRLPGVTALLEELSRSHIPRAVASSSRNTRAVLTQIGLRDQFEVVVDANDELPSKPDPALFVEAARRLNMPAARCVVIEDAAAGVQAADRAGMAVVGVGPVQRLAGADLIVPSLAALRLARLEALVAGSQRTN